MGLVILGAMGLYLLISVGVVVWAAGYARKNGKSAKRWGWTAALVMYLIPFWDWIPTVAMHRYYCATEAGFWVYKTPEQWKQENPGVMETLVASKGAPSQDEQFDNGHKRTTTYLLNERFNRVVTQQDISSVLPIIRTEQLVTESKRNEVLVRYVDFASGNSVKNTIGPPGPMKFWLHISSCQNGGQNKVSLRVHLDQFRGREK
jgi:hypothetical protein